MSDAKVSRLINLTMALLGKKYITKSTLLQSVEGYSGTPDTMDRMFERDKNDLRDLGIFIDVGGFDPLFDDEPGYRILNSEYALDLGKLEAEEISLLALATDAWRDSTQSPQAQSALRKIRSLDMVNEFNGDGDSDYVSLSMPQISHEQSSEIFNDLWSAINDKLEIVFDYSSAQSGTQSRRLVQPYGLGNWQGAWYLVGRDVERAEIRTFKLSRFVGEVRKQKNTNAFDIPHDFTIHDHLEASHINPDTDVVLKVRKERAHKLRAIARTIDQSTDDNWDNLTITGRTFSELVSMILWHGPDVELVKPVEMRKTIMTLLEMMKSGSRSS